MMYNLTVRLQTDPSPHHVWLVWRAKGEVLIGLTSGYCYPWGFSSEELGEVIDELQQRYAGCIASVRVTKAGPWEDDPNG